MLRDLVNRVKGEIDNERKDREGSEETILNLIEEACNKLSAIWKNFAENIFNNKFKLKSISFNFL